MQRPGYKPTGWKRLRLYSKKETFSLESQVLAMVWSYVFMGGYPDFCTKVFEDGGTFNGQWMTVSDGMCMRYQ
jgi:hypothetical protein